MPAPYLTPTFLQPASAKKGGAGPAWGLQSPDAKRVPAELRSPQPLGMRSPNLASPKGGVKQLKSPRAVSFASPTQQQPALASPAPKVRKAAATAASLRTPPPRAREAAPAASQAPVDAVQPVAADGALTALGATAGVAAVAASPLASPSASPAASPIAPAAAATPTTGSAEGLTLSGGAVATPAAGSSAMASPGSDAPLTTASARALLAQRRAAAAASGGGSGVVAPSSTGARHVGYITVGRTARLLGHTEAARAALLAGGAGAHHHHHHTATGGSASLAAAGTPGAVTHHQQHGGGGGASPLFTTAAPAAAAVNGGAATSGWRLNFSDPLSLAGLASAVIGGLPQLAGTVASAVAAAPQPAAAPAPTVGSPAPAAAAGASEGRASPLLSPAGHAVASPSEALAHQQLHEGGAPGNGVGSGSSSGGLLVEQLGAGLSAHERVQYLQAKVHALERELLYTRALAGRAADTAAAGFSSAQAAAATDSVRSGRVAADMHARLDALAAELAAAHAKIGKLREGRAGLQVELAQAQVQLAAAGRPAGSVLEAAAADGEAAAPVVDDSSAPVEPADAAPCEPADAVPPAALAAPTPSELSDFNSALVESNARLLAALAAAEDGHRTADLELVG
jgi:hypothetical protein